MFSSFTDRLYRSVWALFVPYVLLYGAAVAFKISVPTLRDLFRGLHGIAGIGFLLWLPTVKRPEPRQVLFWSALAIFFFATIPYLEFPSDPWEHYRRLFSWSAFTQLKENPIYTKFSYFWGWTLLDGIPVAWRPIALRAYATFWALVVAQQWYLLARRLGFSEGWAFAQVFGTICFWGTNLFGFYSYYSLSSTMLAYAAYLAALRIWLEFLDGEADRRKLLAVPLALLLALANHRQEVLFFLCLASTVYGYEWLRKRRAISRPQMVAAILTVTAFGCLVNYFWTRQTFAGTAAGYFTRFGLLKLWSEGTPVIETLSLAGLLGGLAALGRFPQEERLFVLTWSPLLWLLSGLFFPLALRGEDLYTSYRILYAFCPSIALVAFLRWLYQTNRRPALIAFSLLTAFLALSPRYPWRGKLWLHYFQVPPTLSLTVTDEGLARLDADKTVDKKCLLASDEITEFLLAVHFQHPIRWSARPVNQLPDREFAAPQHFGYYYKQQGWCGFLTFTPGPIPRSRVANLAKHWFEDAVETNWKTPAGFEALWREGLKQGWKEKTGLAGFRLLVP